MINVIVLTPWYPSINNPGYGIFVREQTKALVENTDVIPSVLFYDASSNFSLRNLIKLFKNKTSINEFDNFKVYNQKGIHLPLKLSISRKIWIYKHVKMFKMYLKDNKTPAIIHAHTYWGGLIALEIKKRYGIPYIVTEHSSSLVSTVNIRNLKIISRVYDEAEHLIAVGASLANVMVGLTDTPIEIIPNSINTSFFKPESIEKTCEEIVISIIGGLIPIKQINLAIKSIYIIHNQGFNIFLNIIGEGPIRKELEDLILNYDATNYIKILGYKNRNEVKQILNESDLYLHTSKHETFGIVLIEAMSMGLPVVSTKSGGPEYFVTEDVGIIIASNTPEAIAEGIRSVIENKDQYISENIRKYVVNNFSDDVISERIIKLYNSIV